MAKTTRKNRTDLTTRNLAAERKRNAALAKRLTKLETLVDTLSRAMDEALPLTAWRLK